MIGPFRSCDAPRYALIKKMLDESIMRGSKLVVYVQGGVPPYNWSITGTKFSVAADQTQVNYVVVTASVQASKGDEELLTVTDACGSSQDYLIRCCSNDICCDVADPLAYDSNNPTTIESTYEIKQYRKLGCRLDKKFVRTVWL